MRNIKLTLEYEGTAYAGWQSQKKARGLATVQEVITDCIVRLTNEATASVIAAGRTDAGVHALGQVASFKTLSRHDTATIKRALNALLPPDIRVLSAEEVDLSFHPRYSAKGKSYVYLIALEPRPSVFLRRYAWAMPHRLDADKMKMASRFFIGKKDFSSMRGSGCGAKTTVREITELKIEQADSVEFFSFRLQCPLIKITIEANAFLRHMVRNIVGTLTEIGRGRLQAEKVPEILSLCDRKLAGPTAPAHGLFLERIIY